MHAGGVVVSRSRRVVAIAGIVLALVFVMLSARRTAMDVFFRHPEPVPDTTTAATDTTRAPSIIAWRIDPENDRTGTIDITPPPPPPLPPPAREDTTTVRPEEPRPETPADLDLDELLDQAAGPRSDAAPTAPAPVPPRPIEITWPETKQLKQCIGQSVTVRIWVTEAGGVRDAQLVPSGVPPACAEAALAAARRIRFEPGRQGGIPVSMWTEVRIDFQRRD
ncbi:MAG TPA: TonB family protein [Candidatus Krumholzibacteria bacterium]